MQVHSSSSVNKQFKNSSDGFLMLRDPAVSSIFGCVQKCNEPDLCTKSALFLLSRFDGCFGPARRFSRRDQLSSPGSAVLDASY